VKGEGRSVYAVSTRTLPVLPARIFAAFASSSVE
jgi:hypothetical protein